MPEIPADFPVSPLFSALQRELLPRIRLGKTGYALLECFGNIDVKSERVAKILRANPFYGATLLEVVRSIQGRPSGEARRVQETDLSLEAATVLMGMQKTRDLVTALQIHRSVCGTHPKRDADGKLLFQQRDFLIRAISAEEAAASFGNQAGEGELAFIAGTAFDALERYLELLTPEAQRKPREWAQAIFGQSIRVARIGASIARRMPDFPARRLAFSACLLQGVGRVALAALDPAYIAFSEAASRLKSGSAVRMLLERRRFGISSELASSLICRGLPLVREAEEAVLFHNEPFLARSASAKHPVLASLAGLACRMAEDPSETRLARGLETEFRGFPLGAKEIAAGVKDVN